MKKMSIVLMLGLPFFAAMLFAFFAPVGLGTIGRLTLPDGTEFRVVQTYSGEPFQVDFYVRRPGEPWGWCYMDHEDSRWSEARLVPSVENHSVRIYRGSTLRAEYFIDRRTFALYGEFHRELRAPQENRIPPA